MTLSTRWAAAAGVMAAPLYVALIVVLGALEPGFSQRTSLMSMLGGVTDGRGLIFNVGVAATGVLVIAFAIGLMRQLPSTATTYAGFALLVLGGLGLIGAAIFHCNPGCRNILVEPDFIGRLHIVASFAAGMGIAVAPFFMWAAMRGNETWKGLATPTLAAAILANLPGVIFWATIFTGYRLTAIEGLIQRAGILVVLIWIAIVAGRLRRIPPENIP